MKSDQLFSKYPLKKTQKENAYTNTHQLFLQCSDAPSMRYLCQEPMPIEKKPSIPVLDLSPVFKGKQPVVTQGTAMLDQYFQKKLNNSRSMIQYKEATTLSLSTSNLDQSPITANSRSNSSLSKVDFSYLEQPQMQKTANYLQ
jgi:hypothetical protein